MWCFKIYTIERTERSWYKEGGGEIMARKPATDIELVVTVNVGDHQVYFTGDLLQHLMDMYNTEDHFYLVVDIKNKTGHSIARTEKELLSLTKLNLNELQNVLSGIERKVEIEILTESELYPLLNQLYHNQVFLTGLINVNNERYIGKVGELAYKEAQFLNLRRGWSSYSLNSDPNIRRQRTEDAYRRILKRK